MEISKKFTIGVLLLLAACQKDLQTADIISDLKINPSAVNADGSAVVTVSVTLTDKAAADKRNVVFTKTGGTWVGGKGDTIIVPANYSDKKIVAKANLIAPAKPGMVTITASSQALTKNGDYSLSGSFEAKKVTPASVHIEPSTIGIGANGLTEVTLTSKISDADGGNVSQGVAVVFEDFLASGQPANGHFRNQQLSSNASSLVSAVYSAGNWPVGTKITLVATILDELKNRTTMTGTTTLTINK